MFTRKRIAGILEEEIYTKKCGLHFLKGEDEVKNSKVGIFVQRIRLLRSGYGCFILRFHSRATNEETAGYEDSDYKI